MAPGLARNYLIDLIQITRPFKPDINDFHPSSLAFVTLFKIRALATEIGMEEMKRRQYLIAFGWATLLASIFALYYVGVETDSYFLQKPLFSLLKAALNALMKTVL